jgi:hypothetical protein
MIAARPTTGHAHEEAPVGFLISALIKFTIWYVRLMIWLVVALIVMTAWCIAAVTGHDRAARSWARSVPRFPLP